MTQFFRFPHTPHLAWLGEGRPRGDKVLSQREAAELLAGRIVVEEKVDGANAGISFSDRGEVRLQNRGQYLTAANAHPQFKPLVGWVQERTHALTSALGPSLVLFGEWCYAVHTVRYTRLPDWFLAIDVYDRPAQRFWSVARRDALVGQLGLALVPRIAAGSYSIAALKAMLSTSKLGEAAAEGIYIRRDDGDWLAGRAKLVRPEFVASIGEHWSRRALQTNRLERQRTVP